MNPESRYRDIEKLFQALKKRVDTRVNLNQSDAWSSLLPQLKADVEDEIQKRRFDGSAEVKLELGALQVVVTPRGTTTRVTGYIQRPRVEDAYDDGIF